MCIVGESKKLLKEKKDNMAERIQKRFHIMNQWKAKQKGPPAHQWA